jgi:hypothetical protein
MEPVGEEIPPREAVQSNELIRSDCVLMVAVVRADLLRLAARAIYFEIEPCQDDRTLNGG